MHPGAASEKAKLANAMRYQDECELKSPAKSWNPHLFDMYFPRLGEGTLSIDPASSWVGTKTNNHIGETMPVTEENLPTSYQEAVQFLSDSFKRQSDRSCIKASTALPHSIMQPAL